VCVFRGHKLLLYSIIFKNSFIFEEDRKTMAEEYNEILKYWEEGSEPSISYRSLNVTTILFLNKDKTHVEIHNL
jgi:hypothetical protein